MSRTQKSKKLLSPKAGALSVLSFEEAPLGVLARPLFPSSRSVSLIGIIANVEVSSAQGLI